MSKQLKFVVTGSEGFIGKALTAFLREKEYDIVCIDRAFGVEASDIDSILTLEGDVACVFHLAAQTSVFNSDLEQIRRDNIDTFMTVCDACREHNVPLVYASSSTAAEGNTTSMYGISKRFNEDYAMCYNHDAVGVRFHNIYGPDPRQGTLLWHLMNDDVVTLYNSGRNVRHFTYIDDAVEGLLYAYKEIKQYSWDSRNRVMNVANPDALPVWEFARLVSERNGAKIRFERQWRDRDNLCQILDKRINLVPLQYKSVQDGLDIIFGVADGETQTTS